MMPTRRIWGLQRWAHGRQSSGLVLAISVALSVIAGTAVAKGRVEVALVISGGIFVLAAWQHFSLTGWCLLLLVTSVAMRGVVTALGLPQSLNFLHYPVAAGFAIAALQRPPRSTSRAPAIWLAGFFLVTMASALANLTNPIRTALFLIITGEPLLIVWALSRWVISDGERRNIGVIVLLLAAVQLPLGALQAVQGGWGDAVKGTLAGRSGGSHVLGALFALGLVIITAAIGARRVGLGLGFLGAAVCVAMMLATGAMAVIILTGITVMVVPLITLARGRWTGGLAPRRLTAILAGATFGIAALLLAQALVASIFERSQRLVTKDKFPELQMLSERASNPGLFMLGSGPGTSASRASLLLIGAKEKGSPLAFFGLRPTAQAVKIASENREKGGGSAESAQSGTLAVIGDLGVIGLVGLAILFLRIWREASRSDDWLASAAQGALMLTAMLIFVDSWLEFPEFALPLAILFGIVLSRSSRSDRLGGVVDPRWNRRTWGTEIDALSYRT